MIPDMRLTRGLLACIVMLSVGMLTSASSTPLFSALAQSPPTEPQPLLTASLPVAGAQFGIAVALEGNTLVVGSRYAAGRVNRTGVAFVFTRPNPHSPWQQVAQLSANDGMRNDEFGQSVAIAEDVIVVGAHRHNNGIGAAYVYTRQGSTWVQAAKLAPDNLSLDARFGFAVAVSGNTVLVGAYQARVGGQRTGSAHVFIRSGGQWVQQARLLASDRAAEDRFGIAVALNGDTALIGADRRNEGGFQRSGAAYIFDRVGTGWVQRTKLAASNTPARRLFGFSVSLRDGIALIGAPGEGARAGRAHVFVRERPARWREAAILTAENTSTGPTRFGLSTALDGEWVVIGAPLEGVSNEQAGAVYVFRGTPDGSYALRARLPDQERQAGDQYGFNVALSGQVMAIGIPFSDPGGRVDAGSVAVINIPGSDVDPSLTKVAVRATVEDETPREGDLVVIDITAENSSRVDATALLIEARLPRGLGFVEADGDGVYDPEAGIWSLPLLPGNTSARLALTVSVDEQQARNLLIFMARLIAVTPPNSEDQAGSSIVSITPQPRGEPNIGAPDGGFLAIRCGDPPVIISLGSHPIVTHAGYDFVYYEIPQDAAMTRVWLDFVKVEVGVRKNGPWYQVFNWGDQVWDFNTSLGAAGIGRNGEVNELVIPITVPPFFGTLPRATGIAIDVDAEGIAPPGTYRFIRISTPPSGCRTAEVDSIQILPEFGLVESFTLVNASTNRDLQTLRNSDVINLNQVGSSLSIRANTVPPQVGSVIFTLNGQVVQRENVPPYALAGDNPVGNYAAYPLIPGVYTLTATPYAQANGQGNTGEALTITFEVVRR